MLRSYFRLAMFALGLLVALQVPAFISDYSLHADAHRLEARQALSGFKDNAGRFFNGDLSALIEHYRSSTDPVFQRDADSVEALVRRSQLFDDEWKALQQAWYARAWHLLSRPNHELLRETADNFKHQLVLEPDAIAWGLAGGVLSAWIADLLLVLTWSLIAIAGGRRLSRRHWG